MSFVREERYIVLKTKNMSEEQRENLYGILEHEGYSKFLTECVVVESDWSIYEDVWDMIENGVQ